MRRALHDPTHFAYLENRKGPKLALRAFDPYPDYQR
jgi:hypothetical protein